MTAAKMVSVPRKLLEQVLDDMDQALPCANERWGETEEEQAHADQLRSFLKAKS